MALPHFGGYTNNNKFSEAVYNMVVELYDILEDQNMGFTIKKKLVSTKGKLVWEDGEEYLFESEDKKIKFTSRFVIVYIEPENYTEKLEKRESISIHKLKGILDVEIMPYLKIIMRKIKIQNILNS